MKAGWWRVLSVAFLLGALAMIPVIIAWGNIPDPFASHWGIDGRPDGYLPKWALPLLPLALLSLGLLIAGLFRSARQPSAETLAFLCLMGTVGLTATLSTVVLNWDAEHWTEAQSLPWWHLVGVLALPVAVAFLGYHLGKRWFPAIEQPEAAPANVIEVAPGETVAWTGTCQVRYPFVIAGIAAIFVVFAPPSWRWFGLPFVVVALLLSHLRVVVNDKGMRARMGGVFWRKVPLEEITRADVVDLEPGEWGGWGYRMVPGRSAMVLRRGLAIDVHLTNGRRFAATVDDAATGAGLINGLLIREGLVP